MSVKIKGTDDAYDFPDACAVQGLYEHMPHVADVDLKPGDVIPFSGYWSIVQENDATQRTIKVVNHSDEGVGRAFTMPWSREGLNLRWSDVMRPRPAFPGGAAMKHPVDQTLTLSGPGSKWNGSCPRCGKGTYTGLFKTEHDGPCL